MRLGVRGGAKGSPLKDGPLVEPVTKSVTVRLTSGCRAPASSGASGHPRRATLL